MDEGANNATNFCPCENPMYNTAAVMRSVSSQFDLICEKGHLASLAGSILQFGIFAGSIVHGYILDRYGRKISCLLSLNTEILFVAMSAAATKYWMFAVSQFLIGLSVGGTTVSIYVILTEICGNSFRPYLWGLIEISYVLCYTALPVISYFITDWQYLQLYTSLPWSFVLLYFFIIPESPRWLLTKGRKKEAIDVLVSMAKKQNMPTENIEATVEKTYKDLVQDNGKQYGTCIELFKTPKVTKYKLIVIFLVLCCSLTHFGVNQYIGRLQGNIHFNVLLCATCVLPGLILFVLASLYVNRKVSMIISSSVTGISLLMFVVIPKSKGWTLAFAVIGQMSAYIAFVQSLLIGQMFPIDVRNFAMGLTAAVARTGGFITPFVVNIGVEWITIAILSILAFFAAFLSHFLPGDKELLDTSQVEHRDS